MNKNAIEIKNLNKTYKGSKGSGPKLALKDIDLEIPKGSIFGLLGPNGAGKSTIINILAGLVVKTSGQVSIWGRDIDTNPRNAKSAIGIVPQEINYDSFFTPVDMLDIQAGMYGVPKAERRTMEILKLVSLEDKAHTFPRMMSGGMRRRLMMAKAMVHSPPVLVLDEPTAGVDVELRKQLWENVRAMNARGVTIVLTTHYLEEAEELCDQIAIINHGEIVACEDKDTLLARIDNKTVRFRFEEEVSSVPAVLEQYHAKLQGRRALAISYKPEEHSVGAIIEAVQSVGNPITDISTDESDLEDVFIQLTGTA